MSPLVTGATVLTVDAGDRIINDGAVYVEDGRIAAVGPRAEVEAAHPDAARVVDGTGKVVLPGFVSTHNHVGYSLFRGSAEDAGLGCVTGQYFPMATVATREERLAVGSLTYAELLKSAVTTTLEMEEEADVFAPFVESLGARSFMGIMTYDVDAMTKDEFRYDAALRDLGRIRRGRSASARLVSMLLMDASAWGSYPGRGTSESELARTFHRFPAAGTNRRRFRIGD